MIKYFEQKQFIKNGEVQLGVPLLDFEGGPGVPLLNLEGGPRVSLLNFSGSRVPLLNFEGGSVVLVSLLLHDTSCFLSLLGC